MSDFLINEFINRLNKSDPPHALLLLGVNSASEWLKTLEFKDRDKIFTFIENELCKSGDLPIKELLIKVLQQVGGHESLEIINKMIEQGKEIHGKYIILDAKAARDQLLKNEDI